MTGVYGMRASLEMLQQTGLKVIGSAILDVRDHLHELLEKMGFEFLSPPCEEPLRSGIVTARHPRVNTSSLFAALEKAKITASLRMARESGEWLRFSMHFYNTRDEMERIANVLRVAVGLETNTEFHQASSQVAREWFGRLGRRNGGPGRLIDKFANSFFSLEPGFGKQIRFGECLARFLFQRAKGLLAILSRELVPESVFVLKDANVAHAERKEFRRGKVRTDEARSWIDIDANGIPEIEARPGGKSGFEFEVFCAVKPGVGPSSADERLLLQR